MGHLHRQVEVLALALAMGEEGHNLEVGVPQSLPWGRSNPVVLLHPSHLVFPADQVDPLDPAVQEFHPSRQVLEDQVDHFLHPFQEPQAAL